MAENLLNLDSISSIRLFVQYNFLMSNSLCSRASMYPLCSMLVFANLLHFLSVLFISICSCCVCCLTSEMRVSLTLLLLVIVRFRLASVVAISWIFTSFWCLNSLNSSILIFYMTFFSSMPTTKLLALSLSIVFTVLNMSSSLVYVPFISFRSSTIFNLYIVDFFSSSRILIFEMLTCVSSLDRLMECLSSFSIYSFCFDVP